MQTKHLEAQMNFDNLSTVEKTKKFGQSLLGKGKSSIKQISKLEITTIFEEKLQNTRMSIVQNSTTVYKLNNKADIKSHLQHQQKILWETKNVITTIRTNSIGLQLQFAVCSCFWPSKSCPTNIWFRVDLYTNAKTVRTAKQQKQLELLYCVYVYEW